MKSLSLEHGKSAYWFDLIAYGGAISGMAAMLLVRGPTARWSTPVFLMMLGAAMWTLVEYVVHRFVLHGMEPFRTWHSQHHDRPRALICTPTWMSGAMIFVLVPLPTAALSNWWNATALTLGFTVGYLLYSVVHHATHHWRPCSRWLLRCKRWHAAHHHTGGDTCFGVTSAFWDFVFKTYADRTGQRARASPVADQ